MSPSGLSREEREKALNDFIEKYLRRGFKLNSHSSTTAELHKPDGFPAWLFHEQRLFVDIDERGWIYVKKA